MLIAGIITRFNYVVGTRTVSSHLADLYGNLGLSLLTEVKIQISLLLSTFQSHKIKNNVTQ